MSRDPPVVLDDDGEKMQIRPAQVEAPIIEMSIRRFKIGRCFVCLIIGRDERTQPDIARFYAMTYDVWVHIPSPTTEVRCDGMSSWNIADINQIKHTKYRKIAVRLRTERCILRRHHHGYAVVDGQHNECEEDRCQKQCLRACSTLSDLEDGDP